MDLSLATYQERELDPLRKARQFRILNRWKANRGVGTAQCVTGFGKTILALMCLHRYRKAESQRDTSVIVVVPTLYLFNKWNEDLEKWGLDSNISILTIQGLYKYDKNHIRCDFLILEEIHTYTSEHFSKVFDIINYKIILGLTATLQDDDDKNKIIKEKCPVIDVVDLEECLKNNWVSNFVIYNYKLELPEDDRDKYNKITKDFSRYFAIFDHDLSILFKCLSDKRFRLKYANSLNWDQGKLFNAGRITKNLMDKRKNMLYGHENKIIAAKEIMDFLDEDKIITFSETIESANKLYKLTKNESRPYHSKIKKHKIPVSEDLYGNMKYLTLNILETRKYFIKEFETNKIRILHTAKAMDLGVDISSIKTAIVLSSTSSCLRAIQRLGRILRIEDGKTAKLIELYFNNTQDEKWLRSRQAKFPKNVIRWIDSILDI